MDKLLTVSVAAYNGAATLAKALDSCLCSAMDALEVLVVDDGSKDNTAALARTYEERWPGTFRLVSKPNGGYGTTITAALAQARGRYFRTLDCDDWFSPGSLDEELAALQACEADVLCTNYQTIVNGAVQQRFDVCAGRTAGPLTSGTMQDFCMEMHALTFRTEVLRRAGLTLPAHCLYTDMLYTFEGLCAAGTVAYLPVQMYCYQLGSGDQSTSLRSYQNHFEDYQQVAVRILQKAERDVPAPRRAAMVRRAADIAQFGIYLLLHFPVNRDSWRRLKAYDAAIRQAAPGICRGMTHRSTKLLRRTGYLAYPLTARLLRDK